MYYLPAVEQHVLLYQPLLFHEFGHVIYRQHEKELDDLVGELQGRIAEALTGGSIRDDRYARARDDDNQRVINVWYSWAQEFFCDAVGFHTGGPAFAKAFTSFLTATGLDDFYQDPISLAHSSHPVSWLRVQLLAARIDRSGAASLANEIRSEWKQLADALEVVEDYHGFVVPGIEDLVLRCTDDMIEEAGVLPFEPGDAEATEWSAGSSLVTLFSAAWQKYEHDASGYDAWEEEQLKRLLEAS